MFENTSGEKLKKLVKAITVAGTLLLIFLLTIIICQYVLMGVKNAQIKRAEEEIVRYQQALQEKQDELAYYQGEGDDYDYVRRICQEHNLTEEETNRLIEKLKQNGRGE